jgi:hypothetical protein
MALTPMPTPTPSRLPDDLTTLTDSQLHALATAERAHHSPPLIYVLCALWFLLMFYFALTNILPPHRCLSHYLHLPNRFFQWAPGKAKFDLEELVRENIKKGEEETRRRRVFAERGVAVPGKVRVKGREIGKLGVEMEMEEVELRMLSPLERGVRL